MATEFDHPLATNNLAFIYKHGDIENLTIQQDSIKSISLFEKAVKLNSGVAAFNLGYIYQRGKKKK